MDRAWYIGRFPEKILIVSPFGGGSPENAERISPESAAFSAHEWFPDDLAGRRVLLEIFAALAGGALTGPKTPTEIARARVRAALRSGTLLAFRQHRDTEGGGRAPEMTEPAEKRPAQTEKLFVEFVFEYPDGSPVKDEPYTLVHPNGREEQGKLPGDGVITKEDVLPGTYTVLIKEVDRVMWDPPRARCGDEVKVRARVTGFVAGAAAKVKIYRELREEPGDEIATLDAAVEDDAVEAVFEYDVGEDDERRREEGVARFVAEVSLDGGKHWSKSARPLEIELPSIDAARWSTPYAEDGDTIAASVDVLGFADGTAAKVEIFRQHDAGDADEKTASLTAKVAGGRVEAAVVYATEGKGDIAREGEYYFEVEIDGDVQRKARSGLLWCTDAV